MTEAPDVYPDFPDDEESDESDDQGVEGSAGHRGSDERPRTGDAHVDAALDSLESLDDVPVSEHPAVFEHAHDALRAALEPQRESA